MPQAEGPADTPGPDRPPRVVARGIARSRALFAVCAHRAVLEGLAVQLEPLAAVQPPLNLTNLKGQKGIETYGRDLHYLHVPCEGAAMQDICDWLAERGVDARVVTYDGRREVALLADVRRMGRQARKLINRCTNIIKDEFQQALEDFPEFTAFRRSYKRLIAKANKQLLAFKLALGEAAETAVSEPIAEQLEALRTLLEEAGGAYEALKTAGRVPEQARAGWEERLLRLRERHRKLAARIEQLGHERRKRG